MDTFIVVFTRKRNIGLTAIAYHAQFEKNQPIKLIEHVTPEHITHPAGNFTEKEKEIISLLHKISDNSLYKRFSTNKEITLKDFMDELMKDARYPTIIEPYIQNILYKSIRLLAGSTISVYFKDDTFSNLYSSDQLHIASQPAEPYFFFELKEEGVHYQFKVTQKNDKEQLSDTFSPTGLELEFITTDPASFKANNQLYFFEKLDHKKVLPFLDKPFIAVPPQQVAAYMKGFVANMIRQYEIHSRGFNIEQREEKPEIVLKLCWDLEQTPAISLYLKYGDSLFLADKGANVFVQLHQKSSNYTFVKIKRNYNEENKIVEQLEKWGLVKISNSMFRPKSAEQIKNPAIVKSDIVQWLQNHSDKLVQKNYTFKADKENSHLYLGPYSLKIESNEITDWFEIKAQLQIDGYTIPFIKFRKNILDTNPEYTLPNGKVFMLPTEWFTRFTDLFHYSKIEDQTLHLPRSHFQIAEQVQHEAPSTDKSKETALLVFPKVELPQEVKATLRPYQTEGVDWLNFLYTNHLGGILADDMGLGKTLQTIVLLSKIYSKQDENRETQEADLKLLHFPVSTKFNKSGKPASIIAMPTSLIHNWQKEISKFAPFLKIYLYTGNNRLKTKDIGKVLRHYHIVLTSYGILRNDINYLKNYQFHYVILDESQYVKNPHSKIYEAINEIEAQHKLVLTGTPIENSLVDLWAQMNFVNQGLLGSLSFFKKHFVLPITRQKDEVQEEKLQKLIQPFILRRTKEHVAQDLPPILEQVIYCDMTSEQASVYEREKSGARNALTQVFESQPARQNSILALKALSKLRQIANHPAMIDKEYKGSSGKFEQIIDTLEYIVAENHNVLIFSSFIRDLQLIEKELIDKNIPYTMLTGKTQKREQVIEEFNRNSSIFLISLKAGGVGLNLTKADYVFMLNPWWNPAAEAQAINRAHRIGQTKNVIVYKFISLNTIEEKIAHLQQQKAQLAKTFVSSNNVLKDLSQEEIIELIS